MLMLRRSCWDAQDIVSWKTMFGNRNCKRQCRKSEALIQSLRVIRMTLNFKEVARNNQLFGLDNTQSECTTLFKSDAADTFQSYTHEFWLCRFHVLQVTTLDIFFELPSVDNRRRLRLASLLQSKTFRNKLWVWSIQEPFDLVDMIRWRLSEASSFDKLL